MHCPFGLTMTNMAGIVIVNMIIDVIFGDTFLSPWLKQTHTTHTNTGRIAKGRERDDDNKKQVKPSHMVLLTLSIYIFRNVCPRRLIQIATHKDTERIHKQSKNYLDKLSHIYVFFFSLSFSLSIPYADDVDGSDQGRVFV